MTFADLISDEAIVLNLESQELSGVLDHLAGLVASGAGSASGGSGTRAPERVVGRRRDVVRANAAVVIVVARSEDVPAIVAALAVTTEPVTTPDGGTARAVLLLVTPRRPDALLEEAVPALTKVLRDESRTQRLLTADSAAEVRGLGELMTTEVRERRLVEDALTPLRYRVFPDTPLKEVVDLMIRRELHAIPVVSESLQVMGIISVGDALGHLLKGRRKLAEAVDVPSASATAAPVTARDIMTRTVLCVSEDQSLIEAANLMVNRDVEQLPVVREGELIGFVTQDAALGRLFGEEDG